MISQSTRCASPAIIHRCLGCGVLHENRVAGDDNVLVLIALAARPLAAPPVPLEYLPRG